MTDSDPTTHQPPLSGEQDPAEGPLEGGGPSGEEIPASEQEEFAKDMKEQEEEPAPAADPPPAPSEDPPAAPEPEEDACITLVTFRAFTSGKYGVVVPVGKAVHYGQVSEGNLGRALQELFAGGEVAYVLAMHGHRGTIAGFAGVAQIQQQGSF